MATGTLPIAGMLRQGALDHRSLPRVAELAAGALERHPLRLLDLVVVVGGVAGDVVAEEEPDGLEHAHAPGPEAELTPPELPARPRAGRATRPPRVARPPVRPPRSPPAPRAGRSPRASRRRPSRPWAGSA